MRNAPGARFVRLTTVSDVAAARILVARLEVEGISGRIHSEALGPYPLTVGQMAEAEIWVLDDRLEEAGHILLDAEVREAVAPAVPDGSPPREALPELQVVAVALIAVVLFTVVVGFMRVF